MIHHYNSDKTMRTLKNILAAMLVVASGTAAMAQVYVMHNVNQPPLLVVDAGLPGSACNGDSLLIGGTPSVLGGTPPYQYSWSPALGLGSPLSPNTMAAPAVATNYILQAIDARNCRSTDSVLVSVANGNAAFTSSTTFLYAAFTDQSVNANTWNWDFGDGGSSTLQNPAHTYTASGSYNVCLIINANQSCSDTICNTVTVIALGITHTLAGVNVHVYPNPSTGNQVNFDISGASLQGEIEIALFDLQGRQVLAYSGLASQLIHTVGRKGLAAGTYQYRISGADGFLGTGKVVFQ